MYFTDKLKSMGAQVILCDPHRCIINGPTKLYGEKGNPTIINKLKSMEKRYPPWIHIVKYDEIPERYKNKGSCETKKSKVLRDYIIANPDILFFKILVYWPHS
jgi:hypothetical protein